MPRAKDTPNYNLKAVVQQTGVKPDTLRAWERRYGLPNPERTEGGHRIYSKQDINIIKWLTARKREGLNIKRAVALWRRLESEGQDPLHTMTPVAAPPTVVPSAKATDSTVMQLRERWVDACLAFDEQAAEQVLTQAFALYPPETVSLEILQKGIAEIGHGWYEGRVTVQQEHFASELAARRLEALIGSTPPPNRPGRILAGCPPQEDHTLALLLLTFLLKRQGWDVTYLGANVPLNRMEATIGATRPQLTILAAQQLHSAATLLEMAQFLRREKVPLAYGGLIFNLLPALRSRIPGHFLGPNLEEAPQAVAQIVAVSRSYPPVEAVAGSYKEAQKHFRERRPFIETHLRGIPPSPGPLSEHLALANRKLARNIDAALALGDINFLSTDIEWVSGLLSNHQMSTELLTDYLKIYHKAAQANLDERGDPIVDWLAQPIRE
jgi:DNA-binding transcriptional MerR regulator